MSSVRRFDPLVDRGGALFQGGEPSPVRGDLGYEPGEGFGVGLVRLRHP
jgi:hypothetical protein